MAGIFSKLRSFFATSSVFDVVVKNCVYAILFFDFLYIGTPMLFSMAVFLKVVIGGVIVAPEAIGSYKAVKDAILSEVMIKSQVSVILDLHLYILGAFLFKKLGKYGTQGFVAFACARAGSDPEKALKALKLNDDDKLPENTPQPISQENATQTN